MKKSFLLDKRLYISIVTLIIAIFLLFFHLGEYALWDDEATTAMFGQTIWQTGDAYAKIGHNLIAYRSGYELVNFKNRYMPPLQFYLAAPFAGLYPGSSFAARFPFALCGILTITLILYWLYKSGASSTTWLLTCSGLLCNVSFMLFFRQCRYYGPTIFLSTLIVYLYVNRDNRKRTLISLSICMFFLLSSNYLSYFALLIGLTIDYFIFCRKKMPFTARQAFLFFLPQLVLGWLLLSKYNLSFISNVLQYPIELWVLDRINIVFWFLRDINSFEFGSGIFIAIAPFLYFRKKNINLIRVPIAILVYIIVIAILSPKPFYGVGDPTYFYLHNNAEIRYISPLIPLCIFVSVIVIKTLACPKKPLILLLALLAFSTNTFQKILLLNARNYSNMSKYEYLVQYRSTIFEYVKELLSTNKSTYRLTSNWINKNISEKETIWVEPGFACYPLMYHAPKALYAWQLEKRIPKYSQLPDIHFKGKIAPNYIISFGPYDKTVKTKIEELSSKGYTYKKIEQINVYWYDLTRPELFLHSFGNIVEFNPESEAVYIYKNLEKS